MHIMHRCMYSRNSMYPRTSRYDVVCIICIVREYAYYLYSRTRTRTLVLASTVGVLYELVFHESYVYYELVRALV